MATTAQELANLAGWEAEAFGRWLAGEPFDDGSDDYGDYDESYAEFGSSWVHGGGSSYDVARAWNSGIAYRAGYYSAPKGEDFDERPEDMPRYGSPEWDAYERAMDERDYMDEMMGY
jgi:hypothetical protein